MYDTIREDNDHIVKIYISFVLNVAAGLTKMCPQQNVYAGAFGSRVRTEYTTPTHTLIIIRITLPLVYPFMLIASYGLCDCDLIL